MNRFALAVFLAVVLGILSLGTARADQTITFRVPVQLSNLYADVKKFSVGCTLRNSANPLATYAFGRADPVVTKAYNGIVNVPVNVPDSVAPQVDSWTCEIHFFASGPGCTPTVNAPVNACKAKAGTPLVTKVQGALTPVGGGRLKLPK
jgi:hypothetical protein